MAEPLNLEGFVGLTEDGICTIEASCATGFEPMVQEEVKELLGSEGRVHRGRVIFDIPVKSVKQALKLRTVNNLWVLVGHTHKFVYPESSEEQLASLANFTQQQTWTKALQVWKDVLEFKGTIYSKEKENNEEPNIAKKPKLEENVPSFRCTCYRTGPNHKFRSNEAQIAVGGKIHDIYNWNPKMKDYDMEVVINCDVDQVYLAIALTNKSLFYRRTITHLGQVCLKPTISAALVRLAKAVPGDIVLDPMCGGGSIPLEGSLMNTGAFFLGGEIDPTGIDRCQKNLSGVTSLHNLPAAPPMDCFQWSALTPCLRDNSVDVIISDLPFGKRSGSKADNRVLYPNTMLALARVVRPDTGRAVLLTQDKNSMFKSFAKTKKYWKLEKFFGVNIGGLKGLVFLFNRTAEVVAK